MNKGKNKVADTQDAPSEERKDLVPRLRFPEFEDGVVWEAGKLESVSTFRRGSFPQPYGLPEWYDDENGKPFVQVVDVGDDMRLKPTTKRKISAAACEQSVYIEKGTVIVTIQGSIGRVAVTHYNAYIDRTLLLFQSFLKPINKIFFAYILQILFFIEKQKAPGGIIKTITKEALSSFIVKLPKLKEQQKIAACLSSIDNLITAHTQKHQALQTYKKGLMQNLFPQPQAVEGNSHKSNCSVEEDAFKGAELVPKLRFPEFANAASWIIENFSNSICLYRGSSPRPIKEYLTQNDNGINWIKIGDTSKITDFTIREVSEKITTEGARLSRKVKAGELVLANSMSYGNTYELAIDGCIYDGWFVLRDYEQELYKHFLLQLLNSSYMQKQYEKIAAGGIVKNISSEIVYSTLIPKPSKKEQQKIATCLATLDTLITAQAEKIAQLKSHKQGLMQQLFPNMESTEK